MRIDQSDEFECEHRRNDGGYAEAESSELSLDLVSRFHRPA